MRVAIVALLGVFALVSADPVRFEKLAKRDKHLNLGLIASTPDEAKAWSKYAGRFDNQINYGSDVGKHARIKSLAFAPMRRKDESSKAFRKRAEAMIKQGARFLLGYNEPNQNGISASAAARDWKKSFLPSVRHAPALSDSDRLLKKYPQVKGVAGGISSNVDGLAWIRSFRKKCKSCRVSRVAFHYYSKNGRSVSDSMNRLKKFERQVQSAAGSTKLVVTEYGSRSTSTSQQISFLKKATSFFRSCSRITDAWAFPNLRNGKFVHGTRLTKVGKTYAQLAS